MPENRYFTPLPLRKETKIILEGDEAAHLTRVMRKKTGEEVELVNGKHQLARGIISSFEKKGVELFIKEVKTVSPPQKKLILAQGILKPSSLDLIIEKGTELGASEFWLFPAEKSEKKILSTNQFQRLNKISISALKQCGRLDLPEIHMKNPLQDWQPILGSEIFFGDLSENAHSLPKTLHKNTTILVIGPEKGFSSEEYLILEKKLHAKGIRFNLNILRAETAAICALSLFTAII